MEHELKMDGTDILVTDENKVEYIELMLRWRLDRGVHEQTQSFVSGFREVSLSRGCTSGTSTKC